MDRWGSEKFAGFAPLADAFVLERPGWSVLPAPATTSPIPNTILVAFFELMPPKVWWARDVRRDFFGRVITYLEASGFGIYLPYFMSRFRYVMCRMLELFYLRTPLNQYLYPFNR